MPGRAGTFGVCVVGGPAGGEQRGSSGVGERDRLASVYGVAGVLGDQAGVLQPP
ncbi:hypothetical protein [Streptomyces tibetensis]|uniref:hypothetical protein n=1 Tax=Streptomyces tibetensis TaxID=2382123 RepID=UPI003F541F95